MATPIASACLDQLFGQARTQNRWTSEPVTDSQLHAIYDIVRMGPTSKNTQPMRLVFLRSAEAKERLRPALAAGNVDKTMTAPVVAIVAHDVDFHEFLPKTFPHQANAKDAFAGDEQRAFRETFAFRNGTLAGGYLIIAVRAVGLDAGPMSGFDNDRVDAEFFPDGRWKSNFLCNIGHGDPSGIMGPRLPRLDFDEACRLL